MLGTTARRAVSIRDDAGTFDVREAFDEHGRGLYAFAYNSTRDGGMAEECVQETFVRAWRARASYRPDRGSERTWLFAIARNVVIDQPRARQRRPTRSPTTTCRRPPPWSRRRDRPMTGSCCTAGWRG